MRRLCSSVTLTASSHRTVRSVAGQRNMATSEAAAAAAAAGSIRRPNSMEDYAVRSDQRVFAPSAARNKQHICNVLLKYLQAPGAANVLEVASGTGEHSAHFAAALPAARFQPTDLSPELFDSIAAHALGLPNVLAPQLLDVSGPWDDLMASGKADVDAIVCINMTHISPFTATLGLLDGAARYLTPRTGLLFIYGPFTVEGGRHTSDSNREFDASLRGRNSAWGYRDVEEVQAQAAARGLETVEVLDMPANNFTLIFRRT